MQIVSKITGDSLSATEFDQITTEMNNLLAQAGITPSSGDLQQVGKAIVDLVLIANFATDGGTADAYVLSANTPVLPPTALKDGMRVRFYPGNSGTGGGSTVNAWGTGAIAVKRGTATGAHDALGDIVGAQLIELQYNLAHNVWVIPLAYLPASTPFRVGQYGMFYDQADFSGWSLCDGRSLLRAGDYASIFGVIGTTFGSADGTHFSLPNARGKVIVMQNNGSLPNGADGAFSTRNRGDTGGEETHTSTTPEMPAHIHSITSGFAHSNDGGSGGPTRAAPGDGNTDSTGGGGAHNNMQPFLVPGSLFIYSGV